MISFKSIKAGFELKDPAFFRSWLKVVIKTEGKRKLGEIQYILCDDKYLLLINKKFLKHDTFTDIITFSSSANSKSIISGEIYISIERIEENMKLYRSNFKTEFSRVLVHGLLHLLGYNDSTSDEKTIMRKKEDYYLNLQP